MALFFLLFHSASFIIPLPTGYNFMHKSTQVFNFLNRTCFAFASLKPSNTGTYFYYYLICMSFAEVGARENSLGASLGLLSESEKGTVSFGVNNHQELEVMLGANHGIQVHPS